MILKYHPDKNQNVSDDVFKNIQKAYDTLSDPKKTAAYDSQLPFDDSIPSESSAAKVYFILFYLFSFLVHFSFLKIF